MFHCILNSEMMRLKNIMILDGFRHKFKQIMSWSNEFIVLYYEIFIIPRMA